MASFTQPLSADPDPNCCAMAKQKACVGRQLRPGVLITHKDHHIHQFSGLGVSFSIERTDGQATAPLCPHPTSIILKGS